MDIDQRINEMEQAATILLNPYQVSRDMLKMSENIFIVFSKSQLTIPQCFHILENSRVELVLFETVKMMKNIIIYEWRGLKDDDKVLLRQKLLDYVINNQQLHTSVVERVLQIVSIMVKRKFLEDGGEELKRLLETIKEMIFNSQEPRVQQVSCAIIVSILQEFTNTVKSEDVVLSFEEHFRCKKMFETSRLPIVFQMILDALEQLIPILDITNSSHFIMMESSLKIMELVLSWSYITAMIPKRIIKAFENLNNIKQQPSLRLSVVWQPLMLRRRTIEIFFIIYWRVRDHGNLQQRAINCLIQLSTLSGPIFQQPNSSFTYFKDYVELLLMMMKTIESDEREAFGIATIIRKLLMIHNVKTEMIKLEENVAKEFLSAMLVLAVKYVENSQSENSAYGETLYTDASKYMLEAWLDVINLADLEFTDDIKHHSQVIFEKFLECHISGSNNSDQEVCDVEETEREAFKEQLIIIGFLGRLNVNHALNYLAGHLEMKLGELCSVVGNPESVIRVFDALVWLVMVSGHVLCMDAVGEKPLIPREINQLSQNLHTEGIIDAQSTLIFLQNSVNLQMTDDIHPSKCDPAMRIFSDVLRLCEIENRAIESGFGSSWSPLISSTICWFIGMFTNSYLYVDASYYCPLAPIYNDLLIPNSPSAASSRCMEFILRKVAWNMHKYHHDVDVVEESIHLFLDIVNVRNQKLQYILELPSFQNLIHMRDVQLDSKVKRSVYKGLVMATAAFTSIEQKQKCLQHLLEPIGNGFDRVVTDGQRSPHETSVRECLLAVLDEMTGVAQGINGQNFSFVYQVLRDRFHRLPEMMLLWRNYLDIQCAILKVLIEMATIQMTTSGAVDLARDFYDVCLKSMQCYMEQQGQRLEKNYNDEEEQPDDVLMVVELFKKLTVQYIFEPADSSMVTSLGTVILSNLMPKMYPILQRFPDITMAYYKSLNCFIELLVCNNELQNLPVDLINHFLYTIKIGLTSFAYPEIQGLSLDLLTTLGDSMINDQDNKLGMIRNLTVEPFGKLLFDVIVTLDLHNENKNDCYSAIYTLCCASADPSSNFCHETVAALVERQKGRLTYVGEGETPEVEALKIFAFRHSREQKMAFIDLIDKFISSICFLYHN
ncbi:CLUMA_CG020975, isoform A [Clunio marinus]|uniref:Exportin-4 n=1 Tax=Clunio marinus TaxID=568069 RepID=A0A1J1JB03_9DIPT|nr:CLUMA_CG020975, isoform A [Clunio marinus]